MQKILKFSNQNHKDFANTLNNNVNQYFKDKQISRFANNAMIFKSIFFLSFWIGAYVLLLWGGYSLPIMYLLWLILGLSFAMVTVNIGHDAIHGAYSKYKWVNNLLAHTFNFNGASAYMWVKMHNQAHHTYTNVEGYDEDIAPIPILRLSAQKPLWAVHKYQYLYAFLIYGLTTISWVFLKDYKKFFSNTVGNYTGKKHPTKEYFFLFFYKFINYTLFIVLPLLFIEFHWVYILSGFLLMHFIGGWLLAMIFMFAHVVEETEFLLPNQNGYLDNNWASHQLFTTTNFGTKSKLLAFVTGGLNTQIEHHLFPNMCSIHYPAISEIVKETAKNHNLPYHELTLQAAFISHQRFLWKMGRDDVATPSN